MQPVTYKRASTVSEAIDLLREGDNARVLAGGTDIIVQARERAKVVDSFVDVKHIPELMEFSYDASTGLTVGAATPLYRLYNDHAIKTHYPALVEAITVIGGTAIQGRASIGGNLANSGPAGDSITAQMCLGAVAHVAHYRYLLLLRSGAWRSRLTCDRLRFACVACDRLRRFCERMLSHVC